MPHRKSQKLAQQTADIAFAAPQVITQRLARMALAGPIPTAKDMHEFYTMGAEKVWSAQQSWMAMNLEMARANQQMMMSMMTALWMPLSGKSGMSGNTAKSTPWFSPLEYQRAMLDIMNKGIAPIRKKAVSNARRLNGAKND